MKESIRILGLLWMCLIATPIISQPCDCVNTGNCPVPINDNGSFQGTLDVTVNGPNDLAACPLVQVCFDITHTWVGDLAVSLTSPNGTNYLVMADDINGLGGPCGNENDNLEVCITQGTGTPLSNNEPYACNTGPCTSGTCCLTGFWTMPCGGVTDPFTMALQAPSCDLNDFNTAGAPANGTWTLTVNDVCANDVGTLNNFSLTFACGTTVCTVCEADGGLLDAPNVTGCFGDPGLNLDLPPNYSGPPPNGGEYGYAYVISQNDIIIAINPTADMSFQPPGEYTICGLSYLLLAQQNIQTLLGMDLQTAQDLLNSSTAPFCGDFSDDCVDVLIGPPVPITFIDTAVCLGDCIEVGDQEVCNSGSVTLESWLGCDSIIEVILLPIFIPPSTDEITVCQGECVEINGQEYCPPGPHPITYESWQGCDSVVTLFIFEEITIANIDPADPPPLSCSNTVVLLDGTSSIPPTSVFAWEGPNNFQSSDPAIAVAEPGEYTLTIVNNALNPPCISTAEVTVTGSLEGPDLQVNSTPPEICQGDTFNLANLNIVDLNNTSPVLTFHSDTPATSSNILPNTVVSPNTTTTYYILGTTGTCTDETSVTVTVNAEPTADFSVVSPICRDSVTTITYTGSAGPDATFNWSFSGGTATPGTGIGPHTVSWATGGSKTITLVVTENGCTSASFSQTVAVDPPIPAPVINCTPNTTSIEFTWNPIPGASEFLVTALIGPEGTMTSDTSYLVTGLNPGDQSSILVEAVSGNACGSTSTQITCTAQDCPPVTVTINPVPDICLDTSATQIQLVASQSGGTGAGAYTWAGPGVNPFSGIFDPFSANTGDNTIVVTYEEGTCLYNASIVINVFPQPTPNFTVISPVCTDDPSTVNYTGNASSDGIFTWDFSGGSANPGTGPGPHSVTWGDAGIYTVSLFVEENGCLSETNTQDVTVEDPLPEPDINCDGNTTSVLFFWDDITEADSFMVNVLAGSGGIATSDTSIFFDGLSPGDVISIEVVALGSGACGNSSAQANCTANDCPDVIIDIDPVADICLDGNAAPFDLSATITGAAGGGILTWSGTGITDTLAGTFDPGQAVIGENTVTATYEESNCFFTEDIDINVFALPIASFTTDSVICEGDEAMVSFSGTSTPGLTFMWEFDGGTATPGIGQGPHTVTWADNGPKVISLVLEDANGCVSTVFEDTVQIEAPIVPPVISCSSTTSSIQFSWPVVPGATDYEVDVLSGQTGTFIPPDTFLVTGLSPDEEVTIALTLTGNGPCPPVTVEETCIAVDCPDVTIDITPVPGICISNTSPVALEASTSGGTGQGTGVWSGTGIVDPAAGIFDASVAGTGTHTITYTYQEDNCSYNNSILIDVFDEPTADFSVTPVICISDVATITYTGNAAADATYTWDFGNGTAIPGTGNGPHTVSWDTPGTYTISLQVEQDGCTSQVFTQDVQVDAELTAPDVNCNITVESVEFTWDAVQGATDYNVTVLTGQAGVYTPPGSYLVDGLMPGDEVTIQLIISGNTVCPPVEVEASCTANDCPDILIDLVPVSPVCLDAQAAPFTLEAVVTGGGGNGQGSWSGNGITDPLNGLFDPAVAGVGTHTMTYTFEENPNCIFSEDVSIEVVAPPVADAGADATLTCKDGETDVEIGGGSSAGPNIAYDWDASFGAFPGDSTILNPVVSLAGTYTLTVTNTDLGCSTSDEVVITASQDVPVADLYIQPVSCFGENDGIISVTGVSGGEPPYLYSLNGSAFGPESQFTQLEPGVYELGILDANGCQNLLTIDIVQPQELNVELIVYVEGGNLIKLGESVQMEGVVTIPEDSLDMVYWQPADMVDCDTCLTVNASPTEQTTFSLTVGSNGCMDSDDITIYVSKDHLVYAPNAFSPNDDGINDFFMLFGSEEQIANIKSFLVFNRWGETVHTYQNFQPNDPTAGWDGTHRGELLNPAVFTWFAEVEFVDGYTELLEGDVTLVR